MMRAIDANIAVRLLARDDRPQEEVAETLIESPFILLPTVLMETAWVLRARFKLTRKEVATRLHQLVGNENARIVAPDSVALALSQAILGHDFADALHLALAADAGATSFATFDRAMSAIVDAPVVVELVRAQG
jgi:predicted nucleic-acid-binding protein